MPIDPEGLVDLRDPGLGHDVHAGVFEHIGTVLPDLLLRNQPEVFPIRFVEMGHISLGIRYHGTVVNTVEDLPIQSKLCFEILHFGLIGFTAPIRFTTEMGG